MRSTRICAVACAMLRFGSRARSAIRARAPFEFLLQDGEFYLLEVNARLQVEHPVTEIRFGCDLVAEQLRIAAGEHVSDPAAPRGATIECRITAEDAEHDFRPAIGRVSYLHLPNAPGVRVDTFLTEGTEIGANYDSLLAKVICYGGELARRRAAACCSRSTKW